MIFKLYIDKKFTASGIRIFVNFLCDTYSYSDIFRCRLDKIIRTTQIKTIPVYLPGSQGTSFQGPTRATYVQSRESFEITVTPNLAIGAGSTYKHAVPNVLYLQGNILTTDHIGANVKFPLYASKFPLIANIKTPYTYSSSETYETLLDNGIKIVDIIDDNKAILEYPFPCNVDSLISCQISTNSETINTYCLIQSTYSGTKTLIAPNPYALVLRNGFVEEFKESTTALAFAASIKADIKKYINELSAIGSIDGVEMQTYEV